MDPKIQPELETQTKRPSSTEIDNRPTETEGPIEIQADNSTPDTASGTDPELPRINVGDGNDFEAPEDAGDAGANAEEEKEEEGEEREEASGEAVVADDREQTSGMPEKRPIDASAARRSIVKATLSAVAIAFVFSGFFIFNNKSKNRTNTKTAVETHEKRVFSPDMKRKAPDSINSSNSDAGRIYSVGLQEITALRDTLLRKQEEIQRLKAQYRDGIGELEKEISDELQKGQIRNLQQAMENKSIVFALRTIQRRQAYIKELESPSEWIFSASEELLYIKRRTAIDIQVAEIAGGIDMNKHMQHINAAVQKYQPTADRLALDTTETELEPFEAIWERILDRTRQYSAVQPLSRIQIISKQICTGNFNRLSEISEISPETAACINEMRGSDLFLNGLNEISPAAARQLFQWKGSWICLNGIRALSPRVAHYLFQWDGNWVSLNGLTEFPAEIGEKLLQWGGNQLELMGLQYVEDFPERIAVEYLAQWERSGGKLFVTQSVRKKINELNREPT